MIHLSTNAKDLALRLRMAKNEVGKATIKSHRDAGIYGQNFARIIAPVKTGNLWRGIKLIFEKQQTIIRSIAFSHDKYAFPYNLWVNQNIRAIRLARRLTRYGTWPTKAQRDKNPAYWTQLRTYASTKHTGIPGYFNKTAEVLKDRFPGTVQLNVEKALKKSLGGK